MAYDQWEPNETEEEWMAVILTLIIAAIAAGCFFGIRGCAKAVNKTKTEKLHIINHNAKHDESTFFVRCLALNQKIK